MDRVHYCQKHDIATTQRCPNSIEVPFWDDHTVSIEALRDEGVKETVILSIVHAVEIDGVSSGVHATGLSSLPSYSYVCVGSVIREPTTKGDDNIELSHCGGRVKTL